MKRYLLFLSLIFSVNLFAQNADSTISFKVSGVCGLCKTRIEKAIKVKGVSKAKCDASTQLLSITYRPKIISVDSMHSLIAKTGHDTELKKASDEDYKSLPDCCLYRGNPATENDEHDHLQIDSSSVSGVVVQEDKKGNLLPLAGATIIWIGNSNAVTSNDHGEFIIPIKKEFSKLIISFAGYKSDTVEITKPETLQIVLGSDNMLKTVVVTSRKKNISINNNDPFRITNINAGELLKAACCNLSESFETNPSVDVQYSDAVTGSKQIQLLGLAGVYTQLTVENLPGPRGLSTPLGLNSIAGPWVESIQMSKGTGSVVNGYESIAGQINIELKKPGESNEMYINGYVNNQAKTDVNVNVNRSVNSKWATTFLLHDDFQFNKTDMNKDGFRDQMTGNLFSAVNRWQYRNNGFSSEFGGKIWMDDRTGGEMNFTPSEKLTTQHYGLGIKTNRYEGFVKAGYIFPEKKFKSIGLQLSTFHHEMDAYFGLKKYDGTQNNFYANLIFQNIIGNTAHKFRTGLNFTSDQYNETFINTNYKRTEQVPGAFLEYTYGLNKFSFVAGLRADYNNLYGFFVTPRLNVRYSPAEKTTIRFSAGRGQRTANIFAENLGSFVSSRSLVIISNTQENAYGLSPEVSWNKGITVDQKFKIFHREANVAIDFFRNDFTNQVVVDMEQPGFIKFYNLKGKSFSNSFQAELNFIPLKHLDVRMAYRMFDVKTTYNDQLLQRPLNAKHRAFINLGYSLDRWKFDLTSTYTGIKRIPAIIHSSSDHIFPVTSPSYGMLNAQVSHTFGKEKIFEVYVGGENLGNYLQHESVIAADQPFSPAFDASLIWGPINGRMVYGGFRLTIK